MKRWALKMGIACGILSLGAVLCAVPGVQAQDGAKTLKVDDFEGELTGWTAVRAEEGVGFGVDDSAKLSIATPAQQPKSGKGSLIYTYDIKPKRFAALMLNRELDLTGMKSLRFSVRPSSASTLIVSLGERNGASYQAHFYCDAGEWAERVVNLDELLLDEPAKDPNGKLDLDQVSSISVMDMSSMLVNIIPALQGSRTLSLDDVVFSSQPAPTTSGPSKDAAGKPVFLVDSFESQTIRWTPLSAEVGATGLTVSAFDLPLRIDADVPVDGGKGSLQTSYTRMAGRLPVLLRDLDKSKLGSPTALTLNVKTARDGTFIIGFEEKDGSKYQQMVELKAGDQWKELRLPVSSFQLDNDSNDENGQLDGAQIKQITIADFTGLLGQDAGGTNTFYVDQIYFNLD